MNEPCVEPIPPYRTHERPLSPEERRKLLDSMGRALLQAQARVDGAPKEAA